MTDKKNEEGLNLKIKLKPKENVKDDDNTFPLNNEFINGEYKIKYQFENFDLKDYKEINYIDPKYSGFYANSLNVFAERISKERDKYRFMKKVCIGGTSLSTLLFFVNKKYFFISLLPLSASTYFLLYLKSLCYGKKIIIFNL